jgi:hypothetical protein
MHRILIPMPNASGCCRSETHTTASYQNTTITHVIAAANKNPVPAVLYDKSRRGIFGCL